MISSLPPEIQRYLAEKKPDADPRHIAVAVYHAHQLQARKDIEALIVERIENLTELPRIPGAQASSPSREDVVNFKNAIQPFQPSDFDNMILERNIEDRCGYALCPKQRRKGDPKGQFRVIWGKNGSGPGGRGKDMKVVSKDKYEKWCSDECAERAMYVRVQLIEQPSWERPPGQVPNLLLLEESRAHKANSGPLCEEAANSGLETKIENLSIKDGKTANDATNITGKHTQSDHLAVLAAERGDSVSNAAIVPERVETKISEREPASIPNTSPMIDTEQDGGTVEGYKPGRLARSSILHKY